MNYEKEYSKLEDEGITRENIKQELKLRKMDETGFVLLEDYDDSQLEQLLLMYE